MNDSAQIDLTKLLNVFFKRMGLIIACFVVVSSLTFYLAFSLPPVYRSSTLILITPQKLPSSYVDSTVTMTIQERIYSITQEILSRTRLEEITKRFGLYSSAGREISMAEKVKKLRENVNIETPRMKRRGETENSFRLSFESESPEKAQQVAAALTSLFIEGNLKIREQRAIGTTAFIKAEANRLREALEKQEATVNLYKAKHQWELPDQLQANLSTLEQFGRELQSNLLRLSSLEDRKVVQDKQLMEAEQIGQIKGETQDISGEKIVPSMPRVESMRTQLEALLSRYSESHPDIIGLKREIDATETGELTHRPEASDSASPLVRPVRNPIREMLINQSQDLNNEIKSVKMNNEMLRKKIALYQARVDNIPARTIEVAKITRTHDITLAKYQDLLGKLFDSQLSENMERKQKAEQFQIIDAANVPQNPVSPNRQRILLMGLIAALGAGFGLAYLLEIMDSSLKSGDELNGYISVPLLASIPAITTRGTVLHKRRQQALLILTSVGALAVGLVGIRFYVQYFA